MRNAEYLLIIFIYSQTTLIIEAIFCKISERRGRPESGLNFRKHFQRRGPTAQPQGRLPPPDARARTTWRRRYGGNETT